jgi:hypothetical protein
LEFFNEAEWQAAQHRRGCLLYRWVGDWLLRQPLNEPLRARIFLRARPGSDECIDAPSTFALCVAESLGLSEDLQRRIGIAATLFWAAADVADDVDDGEVHDGRRPLANDACALLFLATQALGEMGPAFVALGTAYGLRMGGGQARDLAATGKPSAFDTLAIAREKAGAELEFFFRLAALAQGRNGADLGELGAAFGIALQIFSDVADLYISAQSLDLISGKHTLPLALFTQEYRGEAERLLAADRRWPDLQAHLRYAMRGAAGEALSSLDGPIAEAWNQVAPELADPRPLRQMIDWLLTLLGVVRNSLIALDEPPGIRLPEPAQTLARAVASLRAGPAAEIHTWGLFGKARVEGRLFTTVFQTAALRDAGADWQTGLAKILAQRDADGWRYYPHELDIPPDADDAGLILGHFGDALPAGIRDATIAQLLSAFEGEGIHTWMAPSPGNIEWEGDDCPATLANAVWGLVQAGGGASVPQAVWARLTRHAVDRDWESAFYTPAATRYFVNRALAAGAARRISDERHVAAARSALFEDIAELRRWGGFTSDSVLETAFDALAVRVWGQAPPASLPTFFGARQDIDGSWAGEPLFMIPGVDYRPVRWGAAGLTTSIVVQALIACGEPAGNGL